MPAIDPIVLNTTDRVQKKGNQLNVLLDVAIAQGLLAGKPDDGIGEEDDEGGERGTKRAKTGESGGGKGKGKGKGKAGGEGGEGAAEQEAAGVRPPHPTDVLFKKLNAKVTEVDPKDPRYNMQVNETYRPSHPPQSQLPSSICLHLTSLPHRPTASPPSYAQISAALVNTATPDSADNFLCGWRAGEGHLPKVDAIFEIDR